MIYIEKIRDKLEDLFAGLIGLSFIILSLTDRDESHSEKAVQNVHQIGYLHVVISGLLITLLQSSISIEFPPFQTVLYQNATKI